MKILIATAAIFALSPFASATEISVEFGPKIDDEWKDTYGERELERLSDDVREDLERALDKRGIETQRIEVTILDAKPNRPTFEQLGDRPGLDFGRSVSIGGMALAGEAFDADGNSLLSNEYSWFENDIRQSVNRATWGDANRASNRFAVQFAKELSNQ
ncbi:MAG: hypothetical protein AAGJ84_08500 [Pseudomonadota bacterium]